jgi:hypothetical protein
MYVEINEIKRKKYNFTPTLIQVSNKIITRAIAAEAIMVK